MPHRSQPYSSPTAHIGATQLPFKRRRCQGVPAVPARQPSSLTWSSLVFLDADIGERAHLDPMRPSSSDLGISFEPPT